MGAGSSTGRGWTHRHTVLAVLVTAIVVIGALTLAMRDEQLVETAATTTTSTSTSTTVPSTTTSTEPTTTTSSSTTTTALASTVPTTAVAVTSPPAPPVTAPPPPAAPVTLPTGGTYTIEPYRGLGAWVDVYDWSPTITKGNPGVVVSSMDDLARRGVQTLYLQPVRWDTPEDLLDEARLRAIIDRARSLGMAVVAWYLPDLRDVAADQRHLTAIGRLPVDGIGVDIESRTVEDVHVRNERLVALSAWLRSSLPGQVISAIVLPPVVMEDVNPNFWGPAGGPGFPWRAIAPHYDVWVPMSYWTNRRADSGWRDGYRYTAVNIDRIRAHIGQPDAPVHTIGGIGDETTPADVEGMARAARERGAIGGSLYDYRTTGEHLWAPLQAFRS